MRLRATFLRAWGPHDPKVPFHACVGVVPDHLEVSTLYFALRPHRYTGRSTSPSSAYHRCKLKGVTGPCLIHLVSLSLVNMSYCFLFFFTHGRSKLHTPEPDPSESLALLSWSVGEMPTLHYNN